MTPKLLPLAVLASILALAPVGPCALAASHAGAATPVEMVGAYDTLADSILAMKKAEWHMVEAILAATFNHARATLGTLKMKVGHGGDARAEIETLAELVSQLGNEGDASVAAIRKRLVEGGHHHHAGGEQRGEYDEGFVIVTRAARKVFLDAAGSIGRMSADPDMAKLEAEWDKVSAQYRALVKGA